MSVTLYKDIEVRWGEMDAFQHVNNAAFLRYMEVARIQWLDSTEGPWDTPEQGPTVVNINCDFRREIRFPCTVRVYLEARQASAKRVVTTYRLCDAQDESVVYAEAEATLVWIDKRSRRSIAVPPAVVKSLGGSKDVTDH